MSKHGNKRLKQPIQAETFDKEKGYSKQALTGERKNR